MSGSTCMPGSTVRRAATSCRRCQGLGGTERLTLTDAPPAGSVTGFNKVTAGNAATIHFRAEQQGGANTYTTSNSEAVFVVDIMPV
jgi:hypothetical protein